MIMYRLNLNTTLYVVEYKEFFLYSILNTTTYTTVTITYKSLNLLIKSTPSVSSPEVESPFLSNHSRWEVVGQSGAKWCGVGNGLTLNHFWEVV